MRGWSTLTRVLDLRFAVILVLAACDPAIRQIGPGTGGFTNPTGGTTDTAAPGGNYVCEHSAVDGTCKIYYGYAWTEATATTDCGGPVVQGIRCPTDNELGACMTDDGGPDQLVEYYYSDSGSADVQALMDACSGVGGAWLAPLGSGGT